jgi:hypothetical protein
MHLVPTNEEVIAMLRETKALRDGHFEYANGMHANEYLQVALAFRYYQHAKVLSSARSPKFVHSSKTFPLSAPITRPAYLSLMASLKPCEFTRLTGPKRTPKPALCVSANSWNRKKGKKSYW